MASLNKAIIVGNLGGDPELRNTQAGQSVCTFSVATNDTWTDKEGNRREETEWHRITVWGRSADNCREYLHKGSAVLVEGRLKTSRWTDKDGIERFTTGIVADKVQFLDKAPRRQVPPVEEPDGISAARMARRAQQSGTAPVDAVNPFEDEEVLA